MRNVPPHPCSAPLEPTDLMIEAMVIPDIDRSAGPGDHWLWDGVFREFGPDNERYAVVAWGPDGRRAKTYVVVRLLWEHRQQLRPKRMIRTCSASACVNPAHVLASAHVPVAMTLPVGVDARLVDFGLSGVVHIVRDDSATTVCARAVASQAVRTWPPRTPITCRTCTTTWRASGRPLVPA